MSKYSIEDKVFLIEAYFKSDENITTTLRKWSSKHKNRPKPTFQTITDLVDKFKRTGSVNYDTEARSSMERTVRTPEIVENARKLVQEEPSISSRRLSQRLRVSQTTAMKLLKEDLACFPYKIQVGQQLTDAAVEKRYSFAGELCQMIDDKSIDITKIIFTDEAHFWLDGYVNRQNYRIWGTEKPELLRTKPLHPKKLTVWCGLSAQGIIGPFFIETSITSESYNRMLKEQILPAVDDIDDWGEFYFQHDGAPPHTTALNLGLLKERFGSKVIARSFPEMFDCGLAWPPYSPDLSPLDFFLWGYVKDKVYQENPKTLTELKNRIIELISAIPADMLQRAIGSFERRLRMVTHTAGYHIENILH